MGFQWKSLIKKDRHQVFLFSCPGNIPLNFSRHVWFVVNKRGEVSRWETLFRKDASRTSWGHLHKDILPPFQGIDVFPFFHLFKWPSRLLNAIEGEAAKAMIEVIEASPAKYPFCYRYSLTGPNSNTYPQLVLNHLPDLNITLPENAFGKNFKNKSSTFKELRFRIRINL
jgi:hypothetical protein